ncbi:MAG: RNA-binding transcriptional accessory protein [Erysipelotrichaceae bacterium]|nr:RNA-binding transcriptional accessory protein [Erysipelotrichaceae bacterium]
MYQELIKQKLQEELDIELKHVENVINFLNEGCTIPFIARYRKEWTGSMSDEKLRIFNEKYTYFNNFYDRLDTILRTIEEQGKLTDEIRASLNNAKTLSELEDIYRPFKPKKATRASKAKEKGLEPLANYLLMQVNNDDFDDVVSSFINEEKGVKSKEEALQGAKDIIAEMISDEAKYRKFIRNNMMKTFNITTKRNPKGEDEREIFSMYYDFSESLSKVASHRILAINRGEKLNVLKVELTGEDDNNTNHIASKIIKKNSPFQDILLDTIQDAYKRLIKPSIDNEILADLTETSENTSIEVFKSNLKELLLEAPTKNKIILGFDPGIRTGCKIGIVDRLGKVLYTGVLYGTSEKEEILKNEAKKLAVLIARYHVDLISLGNGTGGRESERFIKKYLFEMFPECKIDYVITNEAGASVYSASKLGTQEFPNLDVSVRSAISLARRVQDPLAELVKIDPKSIGVGQYQHDMNQKHLGEALGGVVENCVNQVGVDINSASPSLLTYVSGINSSIASNIVKYREENGEFKNRKDLLNVPKLGEKAYQQCAGFLRIQDHYPLDNTGIHPESYEVTLKLLKLINSDISEIGEDTLALKLATSKSVSVLAKELKVGEETLKDIIEELEKPGRDIRDINVKAELRNDVCDITDLKEGMILDGTVRNIIDFGAFIDIGVHQDGLVHISEISSKFIKHPLDELHIGQIVKVKVISVDVKKRRIGLSIKQAK